MYFNKVYIHVQLLYIIIHTLKYLMQVASLVVSCKRTRTAKTAVLLTAGVQVPEYVFEEITLIYLDLANRQFFLTILKMAL